MEVYILHFTNPSGPEEYKDLPREIDPSILVHMRDRGVTVKDATNHAKYREHLKYFRKLRRYKTYKVSPPKDRSLDKKYASGETIMLDRDWQIKKHRLEKLWKETQDAPEDAED